VTDADSGEAVSAQTEEAPVEAASNNEDNSNVAETAKADDNVASDDSSETISLGNLAKDQPQDDSADDDHKDDHDDEKEDDHKDDEPKSNPTARPSIIRGGPPPGMRIRMGGSPGGPPPGLQQMMNMMMGQMM
jgi:hypothetical protein